MADIAPLRPLRYAAEDLTDLVAPPYDVISAAERLELMNRSAHNVVRLILPDGDGDAKYANAAALLAEWQSRGVLVRDEKPAFYRYEQTFTPPGGGARLARRGFLALVRLVPFSDRVVLPHERTLSGPKEDRLKLFRATKTNLSPGFMLYRDPKGELGSALDSGEVIHRFTTPDGIENVLAKVSAPDAVAAIVGHVKNSSLLIADGHHRYETALNYSVEVDQVTRPAGKPVAARPEHRHFMVFLCNGDDPNLVVFATHRLVHSLPAFGWEGFLKKAAALFEVIAVDGELGAARQRLADLGRDRTAFLAVAAGGKKALLALRRDADLGAHPTLSAHPGVVRKTDVAILHSGLLEQELGISLEAQIKKTNLTYLQDPAQGVREVERGAGQVLFVMNPTPVAQVRAVAQAGEVMPQKSTYFYPKILTGLAIHTLDPNRSV
jgi:uncharacterized protein (DUF1015 family)